MSEAEKTYPRHPNRSAAEIQYLRETCRNLFLSDRTAKYPNWSELRELSEEIASLDYSPVMSTLLDRGVRQVSYVHENNSFLFIFGAIYDAGLLYSRDLRTWQERNGLFLERAGMLNGSHSVGIGKYRSPSGVSAAERLSRTLEAWTNAVLPQGVTTFNCPNCRAIVESTDIYCHQCARQVSNNISGNTFGNAPGIALDQFTSMRCPGGCGSEVRTLRAVPDGADPFKSPCPYSCKVTVQAWNKKFEEAKRADTQKQLAALKFTP